MSFRDFVKLTQEQQKIAATQQWLTPKQVQTEWIAALQNLYQRLQQWFGSVDVEAGEAVVAISYIEEVEADDIGRYTVPAMIVETPLGQVIQVVPFSRFEPGSTIRGRVHVQCGYEYEILVRADDDDWFFVGPDGTRTLLTPDSLATRLVSMIQKAHGHVVDRRA